MKALLFVTYTLLNPGHAPETFNSMNQVDASDCREMMLQVADQYGLKNHVYSDGGTYLKARDKNQSVIVTCKPSGK
jgi:hypothetical protein